MEGWPMSTPFRILGPDEVIPARQRSSRRRGLGPMAAALIAGHRLFVPGLTPRGVGNRFRTVSRRRPDLRLRSRMGAEGGVEGVYVWLEPRA
jgi:hypothetical protein